MSMISKFRGAIIGTAIGDALGAPMETMWAQEIAEKFPHFSADSVDYVASLTDKDRGVGRWTDDTQLMIPTAWSIIYMGHIDPEDMAKSYADVYTNQVHRGWGRSTTAALKKVADGVPWFKASEGSLGTGNGPAMKAAPLGLALAAAMSKDDAASIRQALNSIVDVGRITHHDAGVRAGLLQSVLVALSALDFSYQESIEELEYCESFLFNSNEFLTKVQALIKLSDIPTICATGGVTSKAEESWCSTAAVYLKHCQNKHKVMASLVELIKQGGDTDTTGAMLGALVGAKYGELVFPLRLRRRLEDSDNIVSLGDKLIASLSVRNATTKFSFFEL